MEDRLREKMPKIGLALSGGAGRAIAHIGVLEILREYQIPIDYITACSSGTVIAASYACGTLDELKNDWFKWDRQFILSLFELGDVGTAVFSTNKIFKHFEKYFKQKKFEDVTPRLGFVCTDITTGEPVVLALGDLVKAAQASCAVPGLFEPVPWGHKLLVDGGLFSLLPIAEAKGMGAEMVIAVDIAATRHVYKKRYINAWRGYNFLKKSSLFQLLGTAFSFFNRVYDSSVKMIFYSQSDFLEDKLLPDKPDLFSILDRALSIASEQHRRKTLPNCDILLTPKVKHLGKMDLEKAKIMYYEGRRVALESIPKIQKLLENFEKHD